MSEICEAFTCLPDEAERQDWTTVRAVLDYRNARAARALFAERRFDDLARNPALLDMLALMHRAQRGQPLDPRPGEALDREGLAVARAHAPAGEDN